MTAWTKTELNFLMERITERPIDVYGEFAQEFGKDARSYNALQKQMKKLREEENSSFDLEEEVEEFDVVFSDFEDLVKQISPKHIKIKQSVSKDRSDLATFVNDLASMVRKGRGKRPHKHFKGDGASLVLLLSDTHCGKRTKYFNLGVFQERILSIPDKIKENVSAPDLDEIVLLLAGDMIEGEDIYASQAHHIDAPVIDQVYLATRTFWNLAVALNKEFGVPVRFETCPGNHGRMSKTASEKTNWDNAIYMTLGLIAEEAKNPDIVVNVNMDNFHTFPVKDKVGMIYHHGTKHTGTPAMQTKIAGWLHSKKFDFMCHGHWHQWEVGTQFGKLVMKNGSLPGEDDLSERMGVVDPPRQGYLVVRKGKPISHVGFLEWDNEE